MRLILRHGDGAEPLLAQDHVVQATEPAEIIEQVAAAVRDAGSMVGELRGVGLSIGGHISADGRVVHFAPGLVHAGHDWTQVPVAELLEAATGVPAVAENDVNCMCAYELSHGRAQGVEDLVVVYLAPDVEGLGCAIVARGRLVRGGTGGAGEFGHIVIQPDGPLCRCGNRGCLEAMLAVENFDRDMNWGGIERSHGFADAAARLEASATHRAERVFHRSGRYLGQGLATAVNMLNPRMIVLGGPEELVGRPDGTSGRSSELFMRGVHESMKDNAFSTMARDCELVVDELGLDMAVTGAAILVQDGQADGRVAERVA
jgi:predicted NBD/HSP70 family sugar kinase